MSSLRNRILTVAVSAALAGGGAVAFASAANATTPACGNSSLAVTNAPAQGATGHGSAVLLFRNVTHASCTLYGYPGLDAISSTGHVLAHATRTLSGFAGGPGVEKTITLAPLQWASAVVEWMNFNPSTSGACTFGAAVNSTPPNTTHTVKLPIKTSICSLQIHPVQLGTDGLAAYAPAQADWIAGSKAVSAAQAGWWKNVEAYLQKAGTQYSSAINELKALISYPETGLTPVQIAAVHKLVAELNAFFQTPGLYA